MISRITTGGMILIALAMVVSGVWLGMIAWSPTPVWDQWDAIAPEQLTDLFRAHNEHRIAMTRALAWVDIGLAHGTGVISLAFVYIYTAGHAALLLLLARWTWPNASLVQLGAAVALAAALFFSGFQFENFASGFQNQFTGIFFFATSAIVMLCLAATRHGWKRKALIAGSAGATVIGCVTMANGLLIAPLLVVIALFLGLRVTAGIMAAIVAVSWGLYFIGYPQSSGPGLASRVFGNPVDVVGNLTAYVGGPMPNSISALYAPFAHKVALARVFGCVVLVGVAALAFLAIRSRGEARPYAFAWAGIGLFVVGTAAVTAMGRGDISSDAMLASRYGAGVAAAWSVVLIYFVMSARGQWLPASLSLATIICVGLAFAQVLWIGAAESYKTRRLDAEAALLNNVDVPAAFLAIYPSPTRPVEVAKSLRSHELAMYSEPWRRLPGRKIEAAVETCGDAEVQAAIPLAASAGLAWRTSVVGGLPGDARAVAVRDPGGVVVGLLIRGGASDINATVFGADDAPSKWSGYVRMNELRAMDLSLAAVDASGKAICGLAQTVRVDPATSVAFASAAEVGDAIEAIANSEGIFPQDGNHPASGSNPWGGRIWGSWGGDDKNTGKVTLTANVEGLTRVAIPSVTGPSIENLQIEIAVDGVALKRLPIPADMSGWTALEIEIPANGKRLELTATDVSSAWGGWLAVGEPHAMCEGRCRQAQCPQAIQPSDIVSSARGGVVDAMTRQGQFVTVTGWAADLNARNESEHVIAVADGHTVLACVRPTVARPDVSTATGVPALANSGFSFVIPAAQGGEGTMFYARQFDGKFAPLDRR
ncbi:MAG TPA: hypothetical protein PLN33_13520 [Hyphomonadaceae bacterium]|nr:hypothetical protein [Hyphomonadaceae bacterium]HPN06644.1 hypothetical protein [Hyphomonadaceae bacterium]